MNTHTETAAMKRGAPLGPRILPRITSDDDGVFTIYTGKHCGHEGCGLPLTSRNRSGDRLLCIDHARELDRLRQQGKTPRPRKTPPPAADRSDRCPHRQAVHRALTAWLNHPAAPFAVWNLTQAMNAFELRARLLEVLPPSPHEGTDTSAESHALGITTTSGA